MHLGSNELGLGVLMVLAAAGRCDGGDGELLLPGDAMEPPALFKLPDDCERGYGDAVDDSGPHVT